MSNLVWRQSLATLACVLGLFAAAGRSSGASSSAGRTTTAAAAAGAPCESLRALSLPNGTVVSAQTTMPGTIVAAPDSGEREVVVQVPFCRVVGRIPPAINFEVWLPLPAAWNKRFQGIGNGGLSGFISYTALKASLERGYAVVGSDLGHTGKFLDARWAVNAPGLIVDWGHRGVHEMTVAGKRVAQTYYGTAPQRAYFVGCSGGGRMALMEAQRYPEDYDGIVAGDPTNAFTRNVVGRLWTAFATLRDSPAYIPTAKLPRIADAVLKGCDRIDGLADGIIDDPRRCHFDPAVLKCAGVVDGPQCLTTAQADTLKKCTKGL
jgi:feruloyl esterase